MDNKEFEIVDRPTDYKTILVSMLKETVKSGKSIRMSNEYKKLVSGTIRNMLDRKEGLRTVIEPSGSEHFLAWAMPKQDHPKRIRRKKEDKRDAA